ncbi:MAG: DUF1552 domain-containing protein [Minicystis sp.]
MSTKISRRMVLRGALGFTLAIPFLPSVLPSSAKAGPTSSGRKRFVAIGTEHGGIWQGNMYPADATLTDTKKYAGRDVRRGKLALAMDSGKASLSPVLTADATKLTAKLAAKMNVLRGLDVTFYLAHNRGGHLGDYADNDGNLNGEQGIAHVPTIDQVMAWSPSFYGDLATIKERSLVIGGDRMSWGYASPSTKSGDVQALASEHDSLTLFNKIFVPPPDPSQVRPPIADLVLEDYKRLRNGNRRLSAADKQRLDDYIDRLDELQRKLNVHASCGDVMVPSKTSTDEWQSSSFSIDPDAQKRFWQLHNDVIVAAFACDTSRIATMRITDIFSNDAEDWHHGVAHEAAKPDGVKEAILAASYQRVFEDVYLDLITKLDAVQEDGGTLLDSALVQWTHESGCSTHDPIELPVVTAGSAAGFLATGQYCDYRNLSKTAHKADDNSAISSHTGLVYNQYLGNALQAMGLSPSEYESGGNGGYGVVRLCPDSESWYPGYKKYDSAELSVMSEMLPFLKA